jgi:glycerol-3-phosphate dehydrogenase (NAD(P)+)
LTVEGYSTAEAVYKLAQKHNIDMPLVFATYRVLYEGVDAKDMVKQLMQRELKSEG